MDAVLNAAFRRPAGLFPLRFGNDSSSPTSQPLAPRENVRGSAVARHCGRRGYPARSSGTRPRSPRNPQPQLVRSLIRRLDLSSCSNRRIFLSCRRMTIQSSAGICVIPIHMEGDIRAGDLPAEKLLRSAAASKEVVAARLISPSVKHKIVSKAEGCLIELDAVRPSAASRSWARRYGLDARVIDVALAQSRRVVRRKRRVLITETAHGFICANSALARF